jgi:hypothetical protein
VAWCRPRSIEIIVILSILSMDFIKMPTGSHTVSNFSETHGRAGQNSKCLHSMTHPNPSSTSWPAPPYPSPASLHHRSTHDTLPDGALTVTSHRRPPPPPPPPPSSPHRLLSDWRWTWIDPDSGLLSLVRNPNLLGWISHRRRARDRAISASS